MLPRRTFSGQLLVVGGGLVAEQAMLLDAGFELTTVADTSSIREIIETTLPDVVLVAIDQAEGSGIDVCRRLRRSGLSVPLAIVAPRCQADHHARSLDAGADDFITTPLSFDELRARAQALARRNLWNSSPVLVVDDIELDTSKRTVTRDGTVVELTATEYAILELLMRNVDVVLERPTIYERIWGVDFTGSSKSLDVHVGAMRRKLEAHGARVVQTIRSVGYVVWSQPRPELG